MNELLRTEAVRLLAALAVGLLIGLERERRKGEGPARASAGIRTFALASLLGGVAATMESLVLLAVGGAFVATAAIFWWARGDRADPGLTSEVALVLAWMLGALAIRSPGLAVGAAVAATALLAFRAPLHSFARDTLSDAEILDVLLLGVAALVILPVLPDRAMGPLDAVNPAKVWRVAVLVIAVGVASRFAVRLLGARAGVPLAGLASGFVSSTAAVGAMGALATRDPARASSATAGAVLANVASLAQLALVVGVTSPALLDALRWPLLAGAAGATACGVVLLLRTPRSTGGPAPDLKSVDLFSALGFAAAVMVALIGVAFLQRAFGTAGFVVGAIGAGAADVHAAGISVADASSRGAVPVDRAAWALLGAVTANTLVKAAVAFAAGPRAFAWRVAGGLAALLALAWAAQLAWHAPC